MQLSQTNSHELSRRSILTGVAGCGMALASGLAAPPAAEARTFGAGARSGMPWNSGCSIGGWQTFQSFRGRSLDTITTWCQHNTWNEIVALKGGFLTARRSGARVAVSIAPLPRSHDGRNGPNFRLAAAGSFDGYYRQFAQRLAGSGTPNPIVCVGWEVNDDVRPWYAGADPGAYKATFARIATIMRQTVPGVAMEFNVIRRGSYRGSNADLYPGDSVVDVVGMSYYDGNPAHNTEADWQDGVNRTHNGGPGGLNTWLQFAREHNKEFAVREWAIWSTRSGATDNPFYVRKMYEFFRANAAYIAYENYFDQISYHRITGGLHPKASAEYLRLWGRGADTRRTPGT
jgi:hypothetical protein